MQAHNISLLLISKVSNTIRFLEKCIVRGEMNDKNI
jgi:hypothetical protein